MKTTAFILFFAGLLCLPAETDAQTAGNFPTVQTVMEYFKNTYGFRSEDAWLFSLEKHLDGYYLTEYDSRSYPVVVAKRDLIWSAKTQQWVALQREKLAAGYTEVSQISIVDTFYFNHLPCYNYTDWFLDAIPYLEDIKKKDAATVFALGYAWEHRVQSYVDNEQFANVFPKERIQLAPGRPAMSQTQLDTFLRYKNIAAGYFRQLMDLEPNFETTMGPPAVKYANHLMHSFMELQMYQGDQEALRYFKGLKEVPYNAFLLESARNYLVSCPPNALLITRGDNDTYPLLYVQQQEHFRTDVRIVNISMMLEGRFVNNLRMPAFDSKAFVMSVPASYFLKDYAEQLVLFDQQDATNTFITPSDFFNLLKNDALSKETGYGVCPAKGFVWFADKKGYPVDPTYSQERDTVQISAGSDFWFYNNTAILDLILHNSPERPICFAITVDRNDLAPFKQYLRLEGMVLRFEPKAIATVNPYYPGHLDPQLNYRILTQKLQYGKDLPVTTDGSSAYQCYAILSISTALDLLETGDSLKAKQLMDHYCASFPNTRKTMGGFAYYIANVYYLSGYPTEAKSIVADFFADFQNDRYSAEDKAFYKSQLGERFERLLDSLGDAELKKRFEKLRN